MKKRQLGVIYSTVFLDLLGFGIILPSLPFIAKSFGAAGLGVGGLTASYSVAQLLGASILGKLSDRYGRRPIIILSLLGSVISFTVVGFAHTYWILLLGRTLAGAFGGSIAAAQAAIADITTPQTRAKHMGLLGACIGMGFIFGPALGAWLANYGFSAASFVAAGLSAINLVYAFFMLPETRTANSGAKSCLTLSGLRTALVHPARGRLYSASFFAMLGFVSMETTYALLGERQFALTASEMGMIFAAVGIVMAIVQGGLIGRIVDKFGERVTACAGALIMAVGLLCIPYSPTLALSVVSLCVLATGQGLTNPSLSSLISLFSGDDEQGGNLGLSQSLGAAARAVGPIVSGALYDLDVALPYVFAAGLMVTACFAVLGVPGPTRRTTREGRGAARVPGKISA